MCAGCNKWSGPFEPSFVHTKACLEDKNPGAVAGLAQCEREQIAVIEACDRKRGQSRLKSFAYDESWRTTGYLKYKDNVLSDRGESNVIRYKPHTLCAHHSGAVLSTVVNKGGVWFYILLSNFWELKLPKSIHCKLILISYRFNPAHACQKTRMRPFHIDKIDECCWKFARRCL